MNKHLSKLAFFSTSLAFEDQVVLDATDHEMPKALLKPLRSFGYFNCSKGWGGVCSLLIHENHFKELITVVTWSPLCLKIP